MTRRELLKKNYTYPLRGTRASLSPWSSASDPFNKEQEWLNRAWQMLTEQGLTSYSNDEEKALVSIRAIALALMYLDFCGEAFGEDNEEPAVVHWARILKLDAEDVLKINGSACYSVDDLKEEEELLRDEIVNLANNVRDEVYDALLKGFGDSQTFFDSMAEINSKPCFDDEMIISRALPWFSEKMYQCKPYFN